MPLFGHTKILHTLIGMGSTVLVAAVPYPGKAIWISHKGQWITIKIWKHAHIHTRQYAPFLILHISLYAEDATTKSDDSAELQENRACTDQSLQPTTTLQRANQQTEYVLLNASQSGSLSGTTYWYQPSTSPVLLSAFTYSCLVASRPPVLFYFLLLFIPV